MSCNTTSYVLGDLVELSQGLAINVKTKHVLSENGLPLLRIADLISRQYCQFVNPELAPKKCLAVKGDLIYTRTGQVGLVFRDQAGVIHNNSFKVIPDESKVRKDFLYWFLSQSKIKALANDIASGSVQKDLNHSAFKSIAIELPDFDAQDRAIKVLDSIDQKITLNTQTNQTLEQMAQAIFKSWFVDFDPVKAKMNGEQPVSMDAATASLFPEKLVESELGLIPEGWDACLIENVTSKVFSGGTPATKNDEFWGGDLPWFSSGETRNNFIIETEKYITEAGVKGSSTKASAYGDILIASAGQGHTRGQTSFNSIDCYINQSVVALRAASNVSAYWLYYCLERRYDEMRSVSDSHSSRGSLTTKLLKGMPAIRPSKDIVNAFDSLVEPLVRKQIANSNQNRELSALRDILLPKLLSGEIELGVNEATELEA
ncbi:restriction endonuclease subunit S [Vibrio alfacsensis]|uniref:restriction endonuclease subunit S n=1 Tax=Vibrio alfacsensis TaxID=1074311 RepID=UPI0040682D58